MRYVRADWDRHRDNDIQFYEVYRSLRMNINEDNLEDKLVMRTTHPLKVNPVKAEDESLIVIGEGVYQAEHKYILTPAVDEAYQIFVTVDGHPNDIPFSVDTEKGVFTFDNVPEGAVRATYYFDGVSYHDYGIIEAGKEYFGPEAKDVSAPSKPLGLMMEAQFLENRIRLVWSDSEAEGTQYYYRVKAVKSDVEKSKLSVYRSISVREPLADRPYIIEKSYDGVTWNAAARVTENEYFDYLVDKEPPNPVRDLTHTEEQHLLSTDVDVILSWKESHFTVPKNSPLYRVRAVNKTGYKSDASNPVGPVPFNTPVKNIVVRRKIADGTPPTFSGADAVTVATLEATDSTYRDRVAHMKTYTYGVWAVDYAMNNSAGVFFDVTIGDNSKPVIPTNLTVDRFSMHVN